MLKYIAGGVAAILLAVTYQNCGGNMDMGKAGSQGGALAFQFDYSAQTFALTLTTIMIEGQCQVNGYDDHRIEWEYTFGSNVFRGRTDRPCSTLSNRFILPISVGHLTRTEGSTMNFTGILFGSKKGVSTRGPNNTTRITFSASGGTGTTTGGTTGGTTGSCSGTFCSFCPDEASRGITEYCTADYNYNVYCANISQPPDESAEVDRLASERPDLLADCDRRASDNPNWNAFTRELVRRLRAKSPNWGFNGVRGDISDINGDTISWWGGGGSPVEGREGNVVIDVITSCESSSAAPAWQVLSSYCGCCVKYGRWTCPYAGVCD